MLPVRPQPVSCLCLSRPLSYGSTQFCAFGCTHSLLIAFAWSSLMAPPTPVCSSGSSALSLQMFAPPAAHPPELTFHPTSPAWQSWTCRGR